jgi:hypothetical protein
MMVYAYGAGGAAAAAAIAQAIKASGAIVRLEPRDFMSILGRIEEPLVIVAESKVFKSSYHYLTSYKGLAFYAKSPTPLRLSADAQVIAAKRIWIPG